MKLSRLVAKNYRSLRDESIDLSDLNLFIGANASGKSTILDALRFLYEGVRTRDFRVPVFQRGGIIHLTWKGEEADRIELAVSLENEHRIYEWQVRLVRDGMSFTLKSKSEKYTHSVRRSSYFTPTGVTAGGGRERQRKESC